MKKRKRLGKPVEWPDQWAAVESGKAVWDDFTFKERTVKGWLIPYLFQIDPMFSNRWNYWINTLEAGKIIGKIPQIDFDEIPNPETMKNLEKCLTHHCCYASSVSFPDFIQWILYGFGGIDEWPFRVDEKVNEYWYRTFNLGLMLQHPYDYLGALLGEHKFGRWNNPNGFYATPHSLVKTMVQMLFSEDKDHREKSVLEPCVGTGRMLMYASNFSLNLYGQDNDPVCVMACKVNAYLYIPWLVKPAPWLKINGNHRIKGRKRLGQS